MLGRTLLVALRFQSLIHDPLVRCMHVDKQQPAGGLGKDVDTVQLCHRVAEGWNRLFNHGLR